MASIAIPLISGIGSLFGGLFGGGAARKAAQQQVQADQKGINQIQSSETQALGYQNPYLQAGSQASGNLSQLLATPGQGLLTPWTQQFKAPTAEEAAATPGYQFQLQQGENALQNSAAARGGLLSGRTMADLNNYAQGVASTNYQNAFANSQAQYQSAYQTFLNNQQNQYNMLAGQQNVGQNAANNSGNIAMGAGQDIAGLDVAQGRALAGGTQGAANAWGNAIGGIASAAGSLPWDKWFGTSSMSNMNPGATQAWG